MSRYIVRFYKGVSGDNGRQAEICQRAFEIGAPDRDAAQAIAQKKFCDAERISNWAFHADRVEVMEAESPS